MLFFFQTSWEENAEVVNEGVMFGFLCVIRCKLGFVCVGDLLAP